MNKLQSQVVRVLREIRLRPGSAGEYPSMQFLAGWTPARGVSGISVSWWGGTTLHYAIEGAAALLAQSDSRFHECDIDTAKEVVRDILQATSIDSRVFNTTDATFGKKATLFDCLFAPVPEASRAISGLMQQALSARIGKRCMVCVVPRLICRSFVIPEADIHVLAKGDESAWMRLVDSGYCLGTWRPESPNLRRQSDQVYYPRTDFDSILVATGHGTMNGTKTSGLLRLRELLAVVFAVASRKAKYSYMKSMGEPSTFCIQYPHETCADDSVCRSDVDVFFPFYASKIDLDNSSVGLVADWYSNLAKKSAEQQGRIRKAAHFLNLGMCSKNTEAFINCFVSMDALLGRRGSVEASILDGLAALGLDQVSVKKAKWLFELRNELVHGGSRSVDEWPRYSYYVRFFRSDPMSDVLAIAQSALLDAPQRL